MPLGLDTTCGGTGWLECFCGGDLCVCTLYGGRDCLGCPDCRDEDDELEDYFFEEDSE